MSTTQEFESRLEATDHGFDFTPIVGNLKWTIAGAAVVAIAAFGATFALRESFTAHTTFLPPQQQQSAAAAAMASLGALSSLVGNAVPSLKSPSDQYISLMESVTVSDRIIDRFHLMDLYEAKYRVDARKALAHHVVIEIGKKDSLISVDVEDHNPKRAADMANQYIEELRWMTNRFALNEAQTRRMFFEQQLKETRDRLSAAQRALQAAGFTQGALQSEPAAAADEYAHVKAQLTSAEVTLSTLRHSLADNAAQVQQQMATVAALQAQLAKLEGASHDSEPGGYLDRYREFKYEETLFELFSRQYESARIDEARESTLIQVVDPATPPERKSSPKRGTIGLGAGMLAFLALNIWGVRRQRRRAAAPAQP